MFKIAVEDKLKCFLVILSYVYMDVGIDFYSAGYEEVWRPKQNPSKVQIKTMQ